MDRLEAAIAFAEEAGALTLEYFNRPALAVDWKGDNTPVTAADQGAERLLRERIIAAFPEDAILGEEFPDRPGTSGYRWLLDPIDGTKSFIHGVPLYATLIGIEREGEPQIGVVRLPALGRSAWAEKGRGAFESGPDLPSPIPARVSTTASPDHALFLTSEVKTFNETGRRALYDRVEEKFYLTRTWGDAYGYYLVATGRADLMIDPEMSPWDAGPLLTLLEEAGGHFTDWNGTRTLYGGEGLASNDALFASALELTRQFPRQTR